MPTGVKLAFSTFLKYAEFSSKRRQGELRKRFDGKGYRYWVPLEDNAERAAKPGADIGAIHAGFAHMSNLTQVRSNRDALQKVFEYFSTHFVPERLHINSRYPEVLWPLGSSDFIIKIRPEIGFEYEGRRFQMMIWATKSPILSRDTLSVGMSALKHAYAEHSHLAEFVIYDTISGRLFAEADMRAASDRMLQATAEAFSRDLKAVIEERSRPSGPSRHAPPPTP